MARLLIISVLNFFFVVSTRRNAILTSGSTWWKSTETELLKYSDVIKLRIFDQDFYLVTRSLTTFRNTEWKFP